MTSTTLTPAVGLLLLSVIGGTITAAQSRLLEDVVRTRLGSIRGALEGDVVSFRGIPYAQPPIRALRWRAPQPATPWTGVRDGSHFGPMCPQLDGSDVVGDEDCLTLNVWAPRTRGARGLPVMIYLTGGGNHSQSGQGGGGGNFVGTRLVPEGIVLVTLNIRLGALGFLSIPALDAENARHVSGNYGNQDHIAMLHWVHENIKAFGGDPNHVFLFGTSAGGGSICGLTTSPLTRGLFRSAAMESSVPTGCDYPTMKDAQERTGARLAKATGCDTASDVAACMRAKSPRELVTSLRAVTDLFARTYGPVVDGYVFPEAPIARITAGQAVRMPLIIGNTLEETASWIDTAGVVTDTASYRLAVERVFGAELRDRVVSEYPPERFPTAKSAFLRATTDAAFTCTTRRVARTIVQSGGGPVFRYLYTYRREHDPATAGVAHSTEMPFLFQSWRDYTAGSGDRLLSEQMVQFWTHMAKNGSPNSEKASGWNRVGREDSPYMELNVPAALRSGDADTECGFWDSVTVPKPHI